MNLVLDKFSLMCFSDDIVGSWKFGSESWEKVWNWIHIFEGQLTIYAGYLKP